LCSCRKQLLVPLFSRWSVCSWDALVILNRDAAANSSDTRCCPGLAFILTIFTIWYDAKQGGLLNASAKVVAGVVLLVCRHIISTLGVT
jgi:hypothetical protein